MLKKILSLVVLGSLFASSALADDVLALVTKGVVSDNSKGVKVLSLDEMKQVKGGYKVYQLDNVSDYRIGPIRITESMVIAVPTAFEIYSGGVCDMGVQTDCYIPGSKQAYGYNVHYTSSKERYKELMLATNNNPTTQFLAFTLKRTVNWINPYRPTVYYTTGASTVGLTSNGSIYKINSNIGNNSIIRDMSWIYEQKLKRGMGL